jgi:hypothetical protein
VTVLRRVGVYSRTTVWTEIVSGMLGLCLDGELLRASASRFLERTGVPLLRKIVAVRSGGLGGTVVDPTRVGFSSKLSYETLQFSDSVPKLGDFVDVRIVTNRRIINFVHAEAGQTKLDASRAWSLPITLPLGRVTVEAGLGSAVTPALPVVNVEVELKVDHFSVKLD